MKSFTLIALTLVLITLVAAVLYQRADGISDMINPPSAPGGEVTVRLLKKDGTLTEPTAVPTVVKTDAEWRAQLTPEQYKVARAQGTERSFCGAFHDNHQEGVYSCIGCGLPLFRSDSKFDSGTGWPSFFQPIAAENIGKESDSTLGMTRDEIHCVRCGTHLGHVFDDGPAPTGLRFCMNSAAMSFQANAPHAEIAIFAAGCFWGVEEAFGKLKGVTDTKVGYSGGSTVNPSYEDVCTHTTGHAEVVRVEYDPAVISYQKLLDFFFEIHNPTTRNRQGPDFGDSYRSAIFFTTPEQEAAARMTIAKLTADGKFSRPIVTEVTSATPFYPAEEYHQKYAEKHGGGFCHVALPKS